MPNEDLIKDRKKQNNLLITDKQEFGTFKLTDDLKADAEKAVMDRFTLAENSRRRIEKDWDRWYNIYRNSETLSQDDSRTNVFWPITFNAVEDYVAQLMSVFGDLKSLMEVSGKKQEIDIQTQQTILTVLFENLRMGNWESEVENIFRWGTVFGTFSVKCGWQRDENPVLRKFNEINFLEAINGKLKIPVGINKKVVQEIEIEDRAQFEYVDLRNLYFRPDKITWIIERIKTTWHDIAKFRERGLYEISDDVLATPLPDDEFIKIDRDRVSEDEFESMDNDVELLEAHHIPLDIKGKRILCLITLANRKVIRVQPTPFRETPYLIVPFLPQRDSVFGRSLVETIEPLQQEINTRYQQTLDANSLGIYSMMAVNVRYLVDAEKDLKIRKNGVIRLKGTDRPISEIFQFLRPPTDQIAASTNLLDRLMQITQTTTRLKGVSSGEKITPTASATEVISITKQALKSLLLLYKRIDRDIFVEWFNRAYTMNVLNKQKPWTIKIKETKQNIFGITKVESKIVEIEPEDIYTDGVDFVFTGITQERQAIDRMQDMQLLNLLSGLTGIPLTDKEGNSVKVNIHKVVSDVLRGFEKDNPEEYFVPVTEEDLLSGQEQGGGGGSSPTQGPKVNNVGLSNSSGADLAKSAVERGEQGVRNVA